MFHALIPLSMRRLFAVLLVLLLPVQAPLAAVHAADPGHIHVTHADEHGHLQHDTDTANNTDGSTAHDDCHACHCSAPPIEAPATPALKTADVPPSQPLPVLTMPASERPERPKWVLFA